jgi:iron(III) transport system ATP-binding protein
VTAPTALELADVTKSYGPNSVLDGVRLSVPEGSLTALLGPSGCGKTTLLRLVAGFDHPDSGTISVGGTPVVEAGKRPLPPERRRIGYVPQEGALFPHLTVADNILFGLPRAQRRSRTDLTRLLDLTGLPAALADRYPHQLSGGQQQRAALARALAPRPRLVLLDEPFSALDAALRAGTGRAVAEAVRAAGATALLVTHDRSEALSLCDQVAVLHTGRLAQHGSPRALYTTPDSPYVASFVGEATLLPGVASDGTVRCALGSLSLERPVRPGPVQVLLRPEQVGLEPVSRGGLAPGEWERPEQEPGGTAPTGTVTAVSYFGHDALVEIHLNDGLRLVARLDGDMLPAQGSTVAVTVRGTAQAFADS